MTIWDRLIWLALILGGFMLGSVMFSRILPRLIKGKDVTKLSDDGNPGAANVFSTCGIVLGMLCLLLDMGKGFAPVLLAQHLVDIHSMRFSAVLIAPVLGHALAPLNHFRGGKCIATAFGVTLALLPTTCIVLVLAGLYIAFSTVLKISPNRIRSIVTFSLFGIFCLVWTFFTRSYSIGLGCAGISVIAVLRHTRRFCVVPESERADRAAETDSEAETAH